MVTVVELLNFLDLEYRSQARDILLIHSLSRRERVMEYMCIPKVHYVKSGTGRRRREHHFRLPYNPSKFREGDRLLATAYNDHCQGGEISRRGIPLIFKKYDPKKGLLIMDEGERPSPRCRDLSPGRDYTIDQTVPTFFPTYSYTSWGLGILNSGLDHGDYLQSIYDGSFAPPPDFTPIDPPTPPVDLNRAQQEAYEKAFRLPISLIQGPPGTGKTFVIAALAKAFAAQGKRVLISALTHRAINNALNAMVGVGEDIPTYKISDRVQATDLDRSVELVEGASGRKAFWPRMRPPQAAIAGMTVYGGFRPYGVAMLRNFRKIRDIRPERPRVLGRSFWRDLSNYVGRLCEIADLDPPGTYFDLVIFDEASQLLLPHANLVMAQSRHCVFVGDHAQLGPIVNGEHTNRKLGRSVFEHFIDLYPQFSTMLEVSFRMNRSILEFPSQVFYQGNLEAAPEVAEGVLEVDGEIERYRDILAPEVPVGYVQVCHEGALRNAPVEAYLVADIAHHLLDRGLEPSELAIIAPYRRQNNLLKATLEEVERHRGGLGNLAPLVIDTVERIQGQERKVILVSLTVSDDGLIEQDRNFLLQANRLNVILTRAKYKLLVIGARQIFRYFPRSLRLGHRISREDGRENVLLPPHLDPRGGLETTVLRPAAREEMEQTNFFKRWYFQRVEEGQVFDYTDEAYQLYREWRP